ncbi:MAG: hypothetical protein LUD07_03940 [Clostridiales bacterium]|nr:hypothetical protein [Clostridiales bacterium]
MKFSLPYQKAQVAKAEDPKIPSRIQQPDSPSQNTVHHAKEGFFVSCSLSYGVPVNFINDQKDIYKPLIRDHAFVGFPGVDEAVEEGRRYNRHSNKNYSDWIKYVAKTPIDGYIEYYVVFSRPDEQGKTKVSWMLQSHDTPDESGFGMENVPEIMLVTYLDKNGDYTEPFRLESVKW